MAKPKDVDQYIKGFPVETRKLLEQVRATVKKAAPKAEEVISYGMPAYRQDGMLVWFAAFSKHLGFYPGSSGIEAFKKELSAYKGAKGSVQFPLDKPLPAGLISRIVKFRVSENKKKLKLKKKKP